MDSLPFKHIEAVHRSPIARHLGTGILFQLRFNTVGPGARTWFANRNVGIRHYTFRFRWRPLPKSRSPPGHLGRRDERVSIRERRPKERQAGAFARVGRIAPANSSQMGRDVIGTISTDAPVYGESMTCPPPT